MYIGIYASPTFVRLQLRLMDELCFVLHYYVVLESRIIFIYNTKYKNTYIENTVWEFKLWVLYLCKGLNICFLSFILHKCTYLHLYLHYNWTYIVQLCMYCIVCLLHKISHVTYITYSTYLHNIPKITLSFLAKIHKLSFAKLCFIIRLNSSQG